MTRKQAQAHLWRGFTFTALLFAGSVATLVWLIGMWEHVPSPTGYVVGAGAVMLMPVVLWDLVKTAEVIWMERGR